MRTTETGPGTDEAFARVSDTVPRSGKGNMSPVKEKIRNIVDSQPDDASYEEIVRELAFERMVERGLADSRAGRVINDEEMRHRIRAWSK
jgi:predicted transcriptional regulator